MGITDVVTGTNADDLRAGFRPGIRAFVFALGEFGATAFLARADRPTVPVAIARLLGQPGSASIGQASALAVILLLVTAGAAIAIGGGRIGSFGR